MSEQFQVRIGRDSTDVDLHVTGEGPLEEVLLDPAQLKDSPSTAKIQAILYAIEAGVKIRLYWEHSDDLHTLIVPLEGRGMLDIGRFGGFDNPRLPGHTGKILIHAEGEGCFALALELTKQRKA